jgi:small GTP-binding protein
MQSKYKLVFLGDQNVGKTTLISQFVYRDADKNYEPTIGIDFLTKKIEVDDKDIKLQLWDTAGQEKFYSIISSYARDSFLAVILFDVSNESTFLKIDKWVNDLIRVHDPEKKIKVLIVGNKTDLVGADELKAISAKALTKAKQHGGTYVTASAMTYTGISAVIDTITDLVREDIEKNTGEPESRALVSKSTEGRRCC